MTTKKNALPADAFRFPWLTIEVALWGLLLVAALGLRLWRLGAAPLNAVEAQGAWAAWRFAQGQGVPATASYSPLLLSTQGLGFFLFGASDMGARLWPAVGGTALALAPALLRGLLGRIGALLAGALLALSPTGLTLSRTATGDVFVPLGALLCVAGLAHFLTDRPDRPATYAGYAAFGIALLLLASALAYSALLSIGIALLLLALAVPASRGPLRGAWHVLRVTPGLASRALATWVVSFVLLGTAFAWHLGGLGAAASLLPQWLDGFVRWPDSLSAGYPILVLLIYEPFILLAGGADLVATVILPPRTTGGTQIFSHFLTLWSVVALLLAWVRPGHGPGDVLLVLVPLACLAGRSLQTLFEGLRRWGDWLNEGLYLAVSLPLWAFVALNLVAYSGRPGQYARLDLGLIDVSLPTLFGMTLVGLFFLVAAAVLLGLFHGTGLTLRGIGLSTLAVLLIYTIAVTWGVTQNRPADPRELLVLEPTAPEVRLLEDTLARVSNEQRGAPHAIELTLLTDDPALAWVLRDYEQAHYAETPEAQLATPVVVAPQIEGSLQMGEGYIGQSFPLRRRWRADDLACRWNLAPAGSGQTRQLDCSALVRWLVFRRSSAKPAEDRVVLWVRQDLAQR